MFTVYVYAARQCVRRRTTLSRLIVVVLIILAITPYADRSAAAGNQDPPHGKARSSEGTKAATGPATDDAADRKLLTAIESAISAHADHYDHARLDRDLATTFRNFGLDLDVVDPKTAGTRLAGRTATPEIAAAIDGWCHIRKTRLKVTTWHRLVEVAQAADPDLWRTKLRAQLDRPAVDALPALKAVAVDAQALETQPLNSLLVLSRMLYEADDRPMAAVVVRVAKRRFPANF
jgi:hypothetical protein